MATGAACVVSSAIGDTRLPDAMADVMRILAAGINVVGSSPGLLQYPWGVMPTNTSAEWKMLLSKVIRASSSAASTRDSSTI